MLNFCVFVFTAYVLGAILRMLFKRKKSKTVCTAQRVRR